MTTIRRDVKVGGQKQKDPEDEEDVVRNLRADEPNINGEVDGVREEEDERKQQQRKCSVERSGGECVGGPARASGWGWKGCEWLMRKVMQSAGIKNLREQSKGEMQHSSLGGRRM